MTIRAKLELMKAINQRNDEHIREWKKGAACIDHHAAPFTTGRTFPTDNKKCANHIIPRTDR